MPQQRFSSFYNFIKRSDGLDDNGAKKKKIVMRFIDATITLRAVTVNLQDIKNIFFAQEIKYALLFIHRVEQ